VFEAPKFNGTMVVAPAYVTVFWNGILVQHRRPIMGSTSATTTVHQYTPRHPELPLTLQDHSHPVRYRNVWIRRLSGYDQPKRGEFRRRRRLRRERSLPVASVPFQIPLASGLSIVASSLMLSINRSGM
jgi:hypothetical protein